MYTGCGASQDGALVWWHRILDPTHPNFVMSAPRSIKAKSLSCLASAYYDKRCLPDKTLRIDDLHRAALLANGSASLGLVSPIVLAVEFGLRRQAECYFEGVDTSRFETLESLWKVTDARSEEMNKKRQKRDVKVS